MTRTEIIADVAAMQLSPRHNAAAISLREYQSGLPVDQICPDCGRSLEVVGLPEGSVQPRAWAVRCGCGESFARGL